MTVDEHNNKLRAVIKKMEEVRDGICKGSKEEVSACYQSLIEDLKECIFRDVVLDIKRKHVNRRTQ